MKAQIPSNVVGYILTSDYCEIQGPDGHGFAFKRQHPVRGPDGKYDPNAEWCGMFQSRMRSIIKEHGFPILHEEGMKPMAIASTEEEMDPEMALQLQDDEDQAEPPNHLCPTCSKISKERFPNRRPTEPGEYCDACGEVAQPPQETPCGQCGGLLRRDASGNWEHFHPNGDTRHMLHQPQPILPKRP